ncbi:MAG TPA: hypothetical protein VK956_17855, partial [Verrucomicrobium sp.]|nr:hypothetical protein [Verrucomicrobium sp.]
MSSTACMGLMRRTWVVVEMADIGSHDARFYSIGPASFTGQGSTENFCAIKISQEQNYSDSLAFVKLSERLLSSSAI